MALDQERAQEVAKTAVVVAVINALAAPFYWFGIKAGVAATTIANSFALYQMHEQGKDERVVGNTAHRAASMFHHGRPIKNGAKNIAKGGAAFYDEIEESLQTVADSFNSHRP